MRIGKYAAIAASVVVSVLGANAAQAQYYDFGTLNYITAMGNAPSDVACQKGTPFAANAVATTKRIAMTQMQGYWDAVSAGQSPAAFLQIDKHLRWTHGTTMLDKKTIAAIKDPFAGSGHTLTLEPVGYALSGDGLSAIGQWQARDAGGQPVGLYEARFDMTKQAPRISTLQLVDPGTWIDPVVQFCHKPGDVLGYRIKLAQDAVAFAGPRLEAAHDSEVAARTRAEKASAAAAAAPGDEGKAQDAKKAEADLTIAVNSARAYQTMADQAHAELEAAQSDKAKFDAARAAAGVPAAPAKH